MVPPQRRQYCTGAGRFSIGTIAGAYRKDHVTGRSHVFTRSAKPRYDMSDMYLDFANQTPVPQSD